MRWRQDGGAPEQFAVVALRLRPAPLICGELVPEGAAGAMSDDICRGAGIQNNAQRKRGGRQVPDEMLMQLGLVSGYETA